MEREGLERPLFSSGPKMADDDDDNEDDGTLYTSRLSLVHKRSDPKGGEGVGEGGDYFA